MLYSTRHPTAIASVKHSQFRSLTDAGRHQCEYGIATKVVKLLIFSDDDFMMRRALGGVLERVMNCDVNAIHSEKPTNKANNEP